MGSLGVRPLSGVSGSNSNEILTATNIMKNTNQGEGPTSGGPQRISSTASRQPTESAESRAQRVVKTTRQSKVGHGESPKSEPSRLNLLSSTSAPSLYIKMPPYVKRCTGSDSRPILRFGFRTGFLKSRGCGFSKTRSENTRQHIFLRSPLRQRLRPEATSHIMVTKCQNQRCEKERWRKKERSSNNLVRETNGERTKF